MKINLYEKFKHWSAKGPIWVISDPHFEDDDCKLMDPNWPTPEEQVKLINSKVGKKDCLIILGDIGNVEWVKKLKGYKVLVMGNHDKGASNYKRVRMNIATNVEDFDNKVKDKNFLLRYPHQDRYKYEWQGRDVVVDNHLFDEVYEGPLFINDKILLSHEPIKLPFGINIHGHDHAGVRKTTWANENIMFNVASNVINYEPQRLDNLVMGEKCVDIHRLAINKQKKNSIEKG